GIRPSLATFLYACRDGQLLTVDNSSPFFHFPVEAKTLRKSGHLVFLPFRVCCLTVARLVFLHIRDFLSRGKKPVTGVAIESSIISIDVTRTSFPHSFRFPPFPPSQGSRPFLSFDAAFDAPNQPQWALLKQLLSDTFGTPRGHPKSKPFVDRVMSFFVADGKIWVRNYQVLEAAATTALERRNEKAVGDGGTSLVEIGPRFVLEPIRIFAGAFGGPTLFQSASYMSPNTARAAQKAAGGARFAARAEQREAGKRKREATVMPRDELADIFAA
ncbi:unnamed protein product, partial [Phaeothamnion confervicola]